jgi:hypothetical protein
MTLAELIPALEPGVCAGFMFCAVIIAGAALDILVLTRSQRRLPPWK